MVEFKATWSTTVKSTLVPVLTYVFNLTCTKQKFYLVLDKIFVIS